MRQQDAIDELFRHYSATPNPLILVLRDAVEAPVCAEENLTVGNGWRRVARLAQVIHGQKFELLRIGPKNGGYASSARDIQPPGCHHHRTPAFSAVEPLGPPDFSGLAFHTLSGPWSGVDYEDESINARTGKAGTAQATGYDRSGLARNSKVLYNWTRAQINIAPRGPEDNQRLVVACGKCSNGREFKTFAVTLEQESMVYGLDPEFNVQEWEEGIHNAGRNADDPVDALLEIFAAPCSRLETRRQLEGRGHSKAGAYKAISRALEGGLLSLQGDKLTLPEDNPEE